MIIEGDVFESGSLAVARSAAAEKLIVVIDRPEFPASLYLPAVLDRETVAALRDALTRWLEEQRP